MRVGLAHDIGYLEIADTILKKKGELTERQFAIIKTHPERGLKLFQHVKLPKAFSDGILYHHERLDGSGYPDGMTGDEIPRIAKVLAVADFFDAVTSARPHRPALTIDSAFKMMGKLAGKIFDRGFYEILVSLYKDETGGE
jgi:HD-GYP domain-containing protein (c-di-GMP phosphodiesterase class II)